MQKVILVFKLLSKLWACSWSCRCFHSSLCWLCQLGLLLLGIFSSWRLFCFSCEELTAIGSQLYVIVRDQILVEKTLPLVAFEDRMI